MTVKVFWQNPYLTGLETCITSVNKNEIQVAETIFYAFSGGQESDTGTIDGVPVLEARKFQKTIVYTMPFDKTFQAGQPVEIHIDWHRRYSLMRLHFAAELVLELVYRKLGATKIGAHISAHKARIDFLWHEPLTGILPEIKAQAAAIVAGDQVIISDFSDRENEQRYWEILGFARVPCGGTHLRKTGEVGMFDLKRNNIGKGKERIELFLCGNCIKGVNA